MCGREGEGEGEGMSDVVASPLASSVVGYGNKVEESGRRGEERSKKVREKILTSRLRAKKKSHIYFFAFDDFPVLEEKKKYLLQSWYLSFPRKFFTANSQADSSLSHSKMVLWRESTPPRPPAPTFPTFRIPYTHAHYP